MYENRILYEDNYILVCHKPAGIATQTARIGQADMVSEMENYLARKLSQDGRQKETGEKSAHRRGGGFDQPHIYVVHRLDQPVEGILVFAKQKAAAAVLSAQAAGDEMEKTYLALVCDLRGEETADGTQRDGQFAEPAQAGQEIKSGGQTAERMQAGRRERSGMLTDYLLKDGKTNLSRVVSPEVKGAKQARLSYEILRDPFLETAAAANEESDGFSGNDLKGGLENGEMRQTASGEKRLRCEVAKIRLYTGRHHQIRVQMANAGLPLLGDRKYASGEAAALSKRLGIRDVALCAYRLSFLHPKTKKRLQFEIQPEGAAFRGIIS